MKKLLLLSLCLLCLTSCKEEVLGFLQQPAKQNIENLGEIIQNGYIEEINGLDLSGLGLESMPDLSQYLSEERLNSITQIDLSGNELKELSSEALSVLKNIQLIDAANNQIKQVDLSGLAQLKQLNLSNNKLTKLKKETLPSVLEQLDVTNNKLKDISGIVGTKIQTLYASGNKLKNKAIETLETIDSIKHINLSDNAFTGIIKERIDAFTKDSTKEKEDPETGKEEEK